MSAPAIHSPSSSISSSGHVDGLGRRVLAFDRETGAMLERLYVRPELAAFEAALRAQVERLLPLEDERFARAVHVERDPATSELTLVSEFVAGSRLADLLDTAHEAGFLPGVDVALGFLLEALPAISTFHSKVGMAHGLIDPARTVVTAAGQVIFLDCAYGAAIERLGLAPVRLWTELGIAAPPSVVRVRLDPTADVAQVALSAVMLVLGRRLAAHEYPDALPSLLMEIVEVAQIRRSSTFASALQRILQRSLPLPGRRAFGTPDEVIVEVRQLVRREIGLDTCRQALVDFVAQMDATSLAEAEPEEPFSPTAAFDRAMIAAGIELMDEDQAHGAGDFAHASTEQDAEEDEEEGDELEMELDLDAGTARPVAARRTDDDDLAIPDVIEIDDVYEIDAPESLPPYATSTARHQDSPPDYEEPAPEPPPRTIERSISARAETGTFRTAEPVDTPASYEPPVFDAPVSQFERRDTSAPAPPEVSRWSEREPEPERAPESAVESAPASAIAMTPAIEPTPPFEPTPPAPESFAPAIGQTEVPPEPAAIAPPVPPAVAQPEPPSMAAPAAPAAPVEPPAQPEPAAVSDADSQDSASSRRRKRQQRSARARKDKLRSHTTDQTIGGAKPAPAQPAPKAGAWVVSPDRAAAFEQPAPEQAVAPARPLVVPPAPTFPPPPPAPPAPPAAVTPVMPVFNPPPPPPQNRPKPITPIQVAPPAPAAARPAPAQASGGLRLKAEPPSGYAPVRKRLAPDPSPEERAYSPLPFGSALEQEESRGFPWKLAAAAVIIIAIAVVVGRAYMPSRSNPAEPPPETPAAETSTEPAATAPAASTSGADVVIETQPAGVRVLLDGRPMGESPLKIPAVPAGRHVITFVTSSGEFKRTVRVTAGKTLMLDVPLYSGWVAIFAPIVLDVAENGRTIGNTEQNRLLLPPGPHKLTLSNRELGYSTEKEVDIQAGEVYSVTIDPRGPVNFNAVPWGEVWLDNQKIGDTPIANFQVPLGVREFVFKHPQFGERRVSATVRAGAPLAVSVDFTKQ
jgi:hypothetical protein